MYGPEINLDVAYGIRAQTTQKIKDVNLIQKSIFDGIWLTSNKLDSIINDSQRSNSIGSDKLYFQPGFTHHVEDAVV